MRGAIVGKDTHAALRQVKAVGGAMKQQGPLMKSPRLAEGEGRGGVVTSTNPRNQAGSMPVHPA